MNARAWKRARRAACRCDDTPVAFGDGGLSNYPHRLSQITEAFKLPRIIFLSRKFRMVFFLSF